jgi:hypothetical protein
VNQGTSQVLHLSTSFPYKVLSLSTRPEVPCCDQDDDFNHDHLPLLNSSSFTSFLADSNITAVLFFKRRFNHPTAPLTRSLYRAFATVAQALSVRKGINLATVDGAGNSEVSRAHHKYARLLARRTLLVMLLQTCLRHCIVQAVCWQCFCKCP